MGVSLDERASERVEGKEVPRFISRSLLQFIDEPIFSVQRSSCTTSNRARLTFCRSVEHEWLSLPLEDIGTSE